MCSSLRVIPETCPTQARTGRSLDRGLCWTRGGEVGVNSYMYVHGCERNAKMSVHAVVCVPASRTSAPGKRTPRPAQCTARHTAAVATEQLQVLALRVPHRGLPVGGAGEDDVALRVGHQPLHAVREACRGGGGKRAESAPPDPGPWRSGANKPSLQKISNFQIFYMFVAKAPFKTFLCLLRVP